MKKIDSMPRKKSSPNTSRRLRRARNSRHYQKMDHIEDGEVVKTLESMNGDLSDDEASLVEGLSKLNLFDEELELDGDEWSMQEVLKEFAEIGILWSRLETC